MKILATTLFLLTFGFAQAGELVPQKNSELGLALLNGKVVFQSKYSDEQPYPVKIIRVRQNGECGGKWDTCPNVILYFIGSEYGEDEDILLFKLPVEKGWKNIRHVETSKNEGGTPVMYFEMHNDIPSTNMSDISGWVSKKYLLQFSFYESTKLKVFDQ